MINVLGGGRPRRRRRRGRRRRGGGGLGRGLGRGLRRRRRLVASVGGRRPRAAFGPEDALGPRALRRLRAPELRREELGTRLLPHRRVLRKHPLRHRPPVGHVEDAEVDLLAGRGRRRRRRRRGRSWRAREVGDRPRLELVDVVAAGGGARRGGGRVDPALAQHPKRVRRRVGRHHLHEPLAAQRHSVDGEDDVARLQALLLHRCLLQEGVRLGGAARQQPHDRVRLRDVDAQPRLPAAHRHLQLLALDALPQLALAASAAARREQVLARARAPLGAAAGRAVHKPSLHRHVGEAAAGSAARVQRLNLPHPQLVEPLGAHDVLGLARLAPPAAPHAEPVRRRAVGEELDALPTREDGDVVDGDDEVADPQQPLPRRDPVRRDPPHAVGVVDVEAERALGAARNRDLDQFAAERRVVGAVDDEAARRAGRVGVDGEARRAAARRRHHARARRLVGRAERRRHRAHLGVRRAHQVEPRHEADLLGLALAAERARAPALGRRVGLVDLDHHKVALPHRELDVRRRRKVAEHVRREGVHAAVVHRRRRRHRLRRRSRRGLRRRRRLGGLRAPRAVDAPPVRPRRDGGARRRGGDRRGGEAVGLGRRRPRRLRHRLERAPPRRCRRGCWYDEALRRQPPTLRRLRLGAAPLGVRVFHGLRSLNWARRAGAGRPAVNAAGGLGQLRLFFAR